MKSFQIQSISDYDDSSDIENWNDNDSWEQIQVDEEVESLAPIYQNIISKQRKSQQTSKCNQDDDFNDTFYQKAVPDPIYTEGNSKTTSDIETIIVNVAHIDQMPKSSLSYSSTLPCILGWRNTRNTFSSEYPNLIQQYFKNKYTKLSSGIRFFFTIAPSLSRFNTLSRIRQESPISSIMFHYVGYGFPEITNDGIWCSEKRSSEFSKFTFSSLVSKLENPTCYFFDCNNAAVAIEGIKNAEKEIPKTYEAVNSNDYICICSSDVGEKMPDDPKLPKDFLSSCLLTPVKISLLCHVLQYYRLNIDDNSVEPPFHSIWDDNSPESTKLSILLSSIIDSIAADSLQRNIYYPYFRNRHMTFNVFKAYLLAQYLLSVYNVHPKSYPDIPDLSSHSMWKQWVTLLDISICSFTISRPLPLMNDFFNRLSTLFEFILKNEQYGLIKPYHLVLLFYHLKNDSKNDKPIMLLYEYASSNHTKAPLMIASTSFILSLFNRLLEKDSKSPIFAPLCYLIIYILYYNPSIISEIKNVSDLSKLPFIIFRKDLPMKKRVFCAAIIAYLVKSFEKLQEICTSNEFISLLSESILDNEPVLTTYLLLIFARSFLLYSPDSTIFNNGLHVAFTVSSTSNNEIERASSLYGLSSLLRPFDCVRNTQILLLSLTVISDISYLVRFQLVMVLIKYIMTFDFFSEKLTLEDNFNYSSFMEIEKSILGGDSKEDNFSKIDKILENYKDDSKFGYSICLFLLKYFSKDPNEQVRTVSISALNIFKQQEINPNDYSVYQQDPMQEFSDDNLLLRSIIYNTVILHTKRKTKKNLTELTLIPEITISLYKNPIKLLKYMNSNFCVIALIDNTVYYCQSSEKIYSYSPEYKVENIDIFNLNNKTHIGISGIDGCLYIWEPINNNINYSFRVDSRYDKEASTFQTIFSNSETLYTITSNGSIVLWNLISQKLVSEWDLSLKCNVICSILFKDYIYLGCDDSKLYSFNLVSNQQNVYKHKTKITKFIENEGKLYLLDENGNIDIFEDNSFKTLKLTISVQSFVFIDSQTILLCSKENKAFFFYINENKLNEISCIPPVNHCLYDSNNEYIIFGTIDGKVIVKTLQSVDK